MGKKRILIVDDDPNSAREIKDSLEPKGYEVSWAQSAEAAFKKIGYSLPDLILLDLVLPDQSGFKIAQSLKADPKYAAIPIIAISLKKENIDKHIALKSGIAEYFEKPIDYEKLIFCINDIFGGNPDERQ